MKLMKELIIEMLIILAAVALLAVVTFRGVVQVRVRKLKKRPSAWEDLREKRTG